MKTLACIKLISSLARMGNLWQNTIMLGRWIRFFIAIALGAAAGLAYGWLLAPGEEVNTQPENLRIDYRSDVVLMVAEAYHRDQNLASAITRLALLGTAQPADTIRQALLFAERQGYHDLDLQMMRDLLTAVEALSPIVGTPAP
ncbi:MAG: hypothetical protein ACOY16_02260 [Chloroflexota bacterium]